MVGEAGKLTEPIARNPIARRRAEGARDVAARAAVVRCLNAEGVGAPRHRSPYHVRSADGARRPGTGRRSNHRCKGRRWPGLRGMPTPVPYNSEDRAVGGHLVIADRPLCDVDARQRREAMVPDGSRRGSRPSKKTTTPGTASWSSETLSPCSAAAAVLGGPPRRPRRGRRGRPPPSGSSAAGSARGVIRLLRV